MRKLTLVILLGLFCCQFLFAQTTIIPFGDTWKYLDNGSDQGTSWQSTSFDDGSWKIGPAELGYGNGDEATIVSYGSNSSNKYITTYFRKAITISDASGYKEYKLSLVRDDGAVVYINGNEVFRSNMPTGTIAYNTKASASASGGGKPPVSITLTASAFTSGTNVVAVEVHQSSVSSSDLSFDLELIANIGTATSDQTPPFVQSIKRQSPTTETTSATSVIFRVTFSEAVTGVDAGDFTLRGSASGTIAAVSGSGATYDVTVNNISGTGTLALDLKSSGTGIEDAAGNDISGGFTSGETYTISTTAPPPATDGTVTVQTLSSIVSGTDTHSKPQAKAWKYGGKWWCVVPAASNGTQVFRLDGTTWTPVLKVLSSSSRADCWVVGDLVHILLFKGAGKASYIASIQYDATAGTYKLWSRRPSNSSLNMPTGSETATLALDGNSRMWVATEGVDKVYAYWSDAPYTTWSAPITIASGISDDDICAITKLPGKIGVFWSNQNTKRFGFKTHSDGSSPTSWSADEVPGGQVALDNVGSGMADDHLSLVVASDGTLYSAVKTSYNKTGYTQLGLLIRRPSGSWDNNLYPVVVEDGSREGTQAIVVLNEALGRVKVVYATHSNGGYIAYRESATSNISFGSTKILINSGGLVYNHATSTHQNYNPDVVILATKMNESPYKVVSVLVTDATSTNVAQAINNTSNTQIASTLNSSQENDLHFYPNPFNINGTLSFKIEEAGKYSVTLFDNKGSKIGVMKQGWVEAGERQTISFDGSSLINGMYWVVLQTNKKTKVLRLLKN